MDNRTTLSQEIDITEKLSQYDESVKWLLSEKIVLARIMIDIIPEYYGMMLNEVIPLIDGTLQVSGIGVHPGETNHYGRIVGMNTEDAIPGEGKVTYDIRFAAWLPKKYGKRKIQIDMEAQKDYYPGYDIVTRGIYNASRMVSAQKNTIFSGSDYGKIQPVYSIWICMNAPLYAADTTSIYRMNQENRHGSFPKEKVYYDITHVIMVGMSNKMPGKEKSLHRFLWILLSQELSALEKKELLVKEYHIQMTQQMERRLNSMCNLSEAIYEDGIKCGIEKGIEQGIEQGISKMIEMGYADEEIIEIFPGSVNILNELRKLK